MGPLVEEAEPVSPMTQGELLAPALGGWVLS
jgi:hypothetical protein